MFQIHPLIIDVYQAGPARDDRYEASPVCTPDNAFPAWESSIYKFQEISK